MKRTQKTISIKGNRYTAADLLKLDAYETNGGDSLVETKQGEVIFSVREDYLVVKNVGALRRNGYAFGDSIALLTR